MKIIDNIKKNTILLLGITIIVLYFVLREDLDSTVNILKTLDVKFILLAIVFYFISVIIRGYTNYLVVNDKKKVSIIEAIRQNLIAQFFNGITPFQTGGEPMEIYMLTKCDIPLAKATNIKVQCFIFYQIALVLCGIIAIGYNFVFKLFPKVKLLQHLVLLGFLINVFVVILLLMSYSKKLMDKISNLIIKIVKKLKIKINQEKIKEKFLEYNTASQELKGNKKIIFIGITLNMISLISLYIVPLFILYSFKNNSMNAMDVLVSSAYVYLIGAFIPIPGASGGIEYGFTQFFGNFLVGGIINASVIIWRAITYYLGIIVGAIIFNIHKKEN